MQPNHRLPPATFVDDLVELNEGPPPFVTAMIQSEVAIPNAAAETTRHWRAVRRVLDGYGVGSEILDAIAEAIDGEHDRGPAIGVVADSDGAIHLEHFEHPIERDGSWLGSLPRFGPIIADRQSRVPYLLVLTDRVGADISAVRASGDAFQRRSDHDDHPLKKVRGGGWSHRRLQQRAENTWEHNASDVADEVAAIARRFDPRVVFLAGDVRAVELLRDSLPVAVGDLVEVIPGTRAEGGSPTNTSHEVERALATLVASDTRALLEKFREELGQHDRAVEGAAATIAALARGQVEVLLVHDDPSDERTAWFGAESTLVRSRPDEIPTDGELIEGRLVDVAIRAALATGARVRVVPEHGGPAETLGGLLRWAD